VPGTVDVRAGVVVCIGRYVVGTFVARAFCSGEAVVGAGASALHPLGPILSVVGAMHSACAGFTVRGDVRRPRVPVTCW
jgi:hypothetical protein